jgi:hypothetical protein
MARDSVAVQKLGSDLSLASITFTPLVIANGVEITGVTPNTLIHFKNSSAGVKTATIKSVADDSGRLGDKAVSVAAGKLAVYGYFKGPNWKVVGTNNILIDTDTETTWSIAAIDADYML